MHPLIPTPPKPYPRPEPKENFHKPSLLYTLPRLSAGHTQQRRCVRETYFPYAHTFKDETFPVVSVESAANDHPPSSSLLISQHHVSAECDRRTNRQWDASLKKKIWLCDRKLYILCKTEEEKKEEKTRGGNKRGRFSKQGRVYFKETAFW